MGEGGECVRVDCGTRGDREIDKLVISTARVRRAS